MTTAQLTHRAVLTSGIAAAFLLWFAGAPAVAGHGYAMTDHPLRGHVPTASAQTESEGEARGAAVAEASPRARQPGDPGYWLRGDFPTAADSKPHAVQSTAAVEDIDLKAALQIPGSTELRLEQLTLEPGATIDPAIMRTAFICEMVQGEMKSVIDGVSITRNNGDVWTCPVQHVDARHTNSGTNRAVMRVIHLIP